MFIHIVRHYPNMGVAQQNSGEGQHFGPVVARSGWIRWGVKNKPFSFWRNRSFKLIRSELEVSLDGSFGYNRCPAGE